jgi:hypothetical protein
VQIDSSTVPAARLRSPWVSTRTGHPSYSFLLWYLFLDSSVLVVSLKQTHMKLLHKCTSA